MHTRWLTLLPLYKRARIVSSADLYTLIGYEIDKYTYTEVVFNKSSAVYKTVVCYIGNISLVIEPIMSHHVKSCMLYSAQDTLLFPD